MFLKFAGKSNWRRQKLLILYASFLPFIYERLKCSFTDISTHFKFWIFCLLFVCTLLKVILLFFFFSCDINLLTVIDTFQLWNASQLEMVHHGKMHGFMR